MSVLDSFNKARAAAQAKMAKTNTTNRKFVGQNEIQICGKGQGMYFGAFLLDSNNVPIRIIDGYRRIRIDKSAAEKYGITNFELRLCDPSNYINPTEEQKKLVTRLNKMLEEVEKNWDAWQGKIAKYPPSWNKHMTVQYMKISRRCDSQGVDIKDFEPGVKVLMSRSDAYFRAFDDFLTAQNAIHGGMDFISNMVDRDVRHRPSTYMIKSTLPDTAKSYAFSIQEVNRPMDITDEDLRVADNLNREVVDITEGGINVEELSKWDKMFKETYMAMKNEVFSETQDPIEIPEVQIKKEEVKAPEPEPVKEEVKVEEPPRKVEQPLPPREPEIPEFEDDDDPFKD